MTMCSMHAVCKQNFPEVQERCTRTDTLRGRWDCMQEGEKRWPFRTGSLWVSRADNVPRFTVNRWCAS